VSAADRIRIQHMLDAAREAMSFAKGRTVDDLRINRMLLLALVKEIEILGEAAHKSRKISTSAVRIYRGR
jgi:uncharacterized protein with HEPN domain